MYGGGCPPLSVAAGAAELPTTMDEAASDIAAAVTATLLILPPYSRWTARRLLLGRGADQSSGQAYYAWPPI
jgi:hypothetical protein